MEGSFRAKTTTIVTEHGVSVVTFISQTHRFILVAIYTSRGPSRAHALYRLEALNGSVERKSSWGMVL